MPLDALTHGRIIGHLLGFKSREGRFVILENLLNYWADTKKLAGLDSFRIDKVPCRTVREVLSSGTDVRWVFGSQEQGESDPCRAILALRKTDWTAGKRLPGNNLTRWAIQDHFNRVLVICLPPEESVTPSEQTWEVVSEAIPGKTDGDETDGRCRLRIVRKSVLSPRVTERYVRLSFCDDLLPWLLTKSRRFSEERALHFAFRGFILVFVSC